MLFWIVIAVAIVAIILLVNNGVHQRHRMMLEAGYEEVLMPVHYEKVWQKREAAPSLDSEGKTGTTNLRHFSSGLELKGEVK